MKSPPYHYHQHPTIAAMAERRMREWAFCDETAQRTMRLDQPHPCPAAVHPCICISRQAGAGGEQIAQKVAATLGWSLLDRSLLDQVAQQHGVPRPALEWVDETNPHWLFNAFGPLFDRKLVTHQKYLCYLARVLRKVTAEHSAVIVGRGAQYLLNPDCRFAVRVVAPNGYRVHRLAEAHRISPRRAMRMLRQLDTERWSFVWQLFSCDINDPAGYDLVVNSAYIGVDAAAECVVGCCRRWLEQREHRG